MTRYALHPGRVLTWLIPLMFLLGSSSLPANDLEDVTAASDAAHITIRQALAEEDGGLLASVFTDDGAIISPSGQVIRGRLTIRTSATLLFLTMGGGDLKVTRNGINIIDSTAYETGQYTFRRTGNEAEDRAWSGRYTALWRKETGEWRVSRAIGLR